jgi:hypothetical protein
MSNDQSSTTFPAWLRVGLIFLCATVLFGMVHRGRTDEPATSDLSSNQTVRPESASSVKNAKAEASVAEAPLEPEPPQHRNPAAIEAAIGRGVRFLLDHQNKSGSWGSADNTWGDDVYAPVPGAHEAFRAAVTAMCISALIEVGGPSSDVQQSLDRAEAWLMDNLPHVRRAPGDAMDNLGTRYNVWTHSYGISALVHMVQRHQHDATLTEKIKKLIADQIVMLQKEECVDGGWTYLDIRGEDQMPAGEGTSFCAATGIIALHEAKEIGIEPPKRLVDRAIASIRRQQKPDFTYLYSEDFRFYPMELINRPPGSLGRSQVCNLALRLWGDERITDDVLNSWLDRLYDQNKWLDVGRKRPIPHESYFAVAGYFYYYGHYYAARCVELLPESERSRHYDQLAQLMIPRQEADGSWWDFPLYDYHKAYGTSFALMTLGRCRLEKNAVKEADKQAAK